MQHRPTKHNPPNHVVSPVPATSQEADSGPSTPQKRLALHSPTSKIAAIAEKAGVLATQLQRLEEQTGHKSPSRLGYDAGVLATTFERECLFQLDSVLSHGEDTIKQARRAQVKRVEALIKRCEVVVADAKERTVEQKHAQQLHVQQTGKQEKQQVEEEEEEGGNDSEEDIQEDQRAGSSSSVKEEEEEEEEPCEWDVPPFRQRAAGSSLELFGDLRGARSDSIQVLVDPTKHTLTVKATKKPSMRTRHASLQLSLFQLLQPRLSADDVHGEEAEEEAVLERTFELPASLNVRATRYNFDKNTDTLTISIPRAVPRTPRPRGPATTPHTPTSSSAIPQSACMDNRDRPRVPPGWRLMAT